MKLLTRGNSKLGKHIWHTNLPPGISCPAASLWCKTYCYVLNFMVRYKNVATKYLANWELLRDSPADYEAQLREEIAKLKPGDIFRWHVSGDVSSVTHALIIYRICRDFPHITFYLYTRSWNDMAIAWDIEELDRLPNVWVWKSTDESMESPATGREARIFDTEEQARAAKFAVCPEQIGRKENCEACTLCWRAGSTFKLALINHSSKRKRVS